MTQAKQVMLRSSITERDAMVQALGIFRKAASQSA